LVSQNVVNEVLIAKWWQFGELSQICKHHLAQPGHVN
jgi:hypothetical protein